MKQAWRLEYERMHDIAKIIQIVANSQISQVESIIDF